MYDMQMNLIPRVILLGVMHKFKELCSWYSPSFSLCDNNIRSSSVNTWITIKDECTDRQRADIRQNESTITPLFWIIKIFGENGMSSSLLITKRLNHTKYFRINNSWTLRDSNSWAVSKFRCVFFFKQHYIDSSHIFPAHAWCWTQVASIRAPANYPAITKVTAINYGCYAHDSITHLQLGRPFPTTYRKGKLLSYTWLSQTKIYRAKLAKPLQVK